MRRRRETLLNLLEKLAILYPFYFGNTWSNHAILGEYFLIFSWAILMAFSWPILFTRAILLALL